MPPYTCDICDMRIYAWCYRTLHIHTSMCETLYFPDMDYQDADDKAFEKLNNAPSRIYANMTPRLQSPPNNGMYENTNNIMNIPKNVSSSDFNKIV